MPLWQESQNFRDWEGHRQASGTLGKTVLIMEEKTALSLTSLQHEWTWVLSGNTAFTKSIEWVSNRAGGRIRTS